jgi:hypothetical protein
MEKNLAIQGGISYSAKSERAELILLLINSQNHGGWDEAN